MNKYIKYLKPLILLIILFIVSIQTYRFISKRFNQVKILKQVVSRLEADTRVAEVLVTGVNYDENAKKNYTRIKFLEYDSQGNPLKPKYFEFTGNIIQFQSLVIRFDDINIRNADKLKGKSAYVFWKVFLLDGKDTQEYEINQINEIPNGYKVGGINEPFERELWTKFWDHALDPEQASKGGIKNAQIEAPGMLFVPGILYTIKIEHDGGLRIDSTPLSPILRGERIPQQPIQARVLN